MAFQVHSIEAGLAWCHLIEHDDGLVLVDAGSYGHADRILRRIKATGKPLQLLFITHAHLDHYGNALQIKQALDVPVAVHGADAEAMSRGETHLGSVRLWGHLIKLMLPVVERFVGPEPLQADVIVDDGDDLSAYGIASRVVHLPGHTPGSCALVTEDGAAFVGDLVSPMLYPHAQMLYAIDWREMADSVRRLQELEPREVYSGHGGKPMSGESIQRIKPYKY